MTQQISLACRGQSLQSRDDGRITGGSQILHGDFYQHRLRLRGMARTASESRPKLWKSLRQYGQQACTDTVAGVAFVGVGRVVNKLNRLVYQPFTQSSRRNLQQRPVKHHATALESRRHGRQAGQTCPTAKRQQQRLDLVVSMLTEQNAMHVL